MFIRNRLHFQWSVSDFDEILYAPEFKMKRKALNNLFFTFFLFILKAKFIHVVLRSIYLTFKSVLIPKVEYCSPQGHSVPL